MLEPNQVPIGRHVSLFDMLTLISLAGALGGSLAVADGMGLAGYIASATGLLLGILCVVAIRKSLRLFGKYLPRSKAAGFLLYALTVACIGASTAIGFVSSSQLLRALHLAAH